MIPGTLFHTSKGVFIYLHPNTSTEVYLLSSQAPVVTLETVSNEVSGGPDLIALLTSDGIGYVSLEEFMEASR